jgi:hypothetical protein
LVGIIVDLLRKCSELGLGEVLDLGNDAVDQRASANRQWCGRQGAQGWPVAVEAVVTELVSSVQFPGNREINRESPHFGAIFGGNRQNRRVNSIGYGQIP